MRLTPSTLTVLLLIVAAAGACGDGAGRPTAEAEADSGRGARVAFVPPWQTVIDTIGDTVVVRTSAATDEAAALRLVEDVRVHELGDAAEYQFADVNFVVPAPGDGMYVWDRGAAVLREYDSTGAFVRRIGNRGSGPGEYRSASGLIPLSDGRLLLWDPQNARMNLYDSTGASIGSWRYQNTLGLTRPWGLLADTAGNVYARRLFRPSGIARQTLTLSASREGFQVFGPDGMVLDSLRPPPWLPRAVEIVAIGDAGGGFVERVPFAPQPAWTVSRFGYLVSGVGDRYAITLHRPDSPLRIERELERVPVQPDEKANAQEIVTAELRRMDPAWQWNGPPIPDVKPFFSAIRAAADGRLWIQREGRGVQVEPEEISSEALIPPRGGAIGRPRTPPRRWYEPVLFDIFAPDGRLLGAITVPERARVLYMRDDQVWGVETDSLDVPRVVRWHIEPSVEAREGGR